MSSTRKIPAIFYRSSSGDEPVREWLKSLDKADRQVIGEDIAYVQYKWPIGKPRVDHLRGAIWEVRSKIGNRIARVLFAVEESEMILLHAFVKKTQQTNPNDIELATKRLKEWKMAKATKVNPHAGSSFDDFLKEDGIFEEVQARALKRALAEQLDEAMKSGKLSKVNMAQRMATSRSQLNRVLDPSNLSIQLDTLIKAASAVGRTVEIRLRPD